MKSMKAIRQTIKTVCNESGFQGLCGLVLQSE
uniref:Uncharacterized protein n=1 Tax=Anguilla anguilla TaxID=7936 RepID=A0A0E9VGN2_ANGAN